VEAALVFSPWIRKHAADIVAELGAISLARGVADGAKPSICSSRVSKGWYKLLRS